MIAQGVVVEQDARDDERAREWPPARLVGTRNESATEVAVVPQELLAGPLLRRHENERSPSYGCDL